MPLPETLRNTPQWLVSGKDKAPRSAKTGSLADVRDPKNYSTFDEASHYAAVNGLDVGFALTPQDPFTVVDLDNKVDDPATPEQLERFRKILEAFDTYAELSRSGNGVHIWCLGRVPRGVKRDKVEIYTESRYMICTGRVVKDRPVTDQQALLDLLFEEVSRGALSLSDLVEEESTRTDAEVITMGSEAVNGEKFDKLCRGEWQDDYPSQSEADFALMNMLCFYTRSNEQCRRLFRMTGLGQRQKAQRDKYLAYMISKIRAEEAPPIDFSALRTNGASPESHGPNTRNEIHEATGSGGAPVLTPPPPIPSPELETAAGKAVEGEISYPPGFVGEIARYIVDSSTRPVREVGIAAAIALCAGVLGRQFNISGTGLNQYLVLIAKTGIGKEGGASGIGLLLHEVRQKVPAVDYFVGPGTFASGQGIIRALDEKHCFFSVLGEFGLTLQMLSDPNAAGHTIVMRRVLLDLYTKSGKTAILHSSAYSDKEKNTKTLVAPSMTIFGEATPETFYAGLSQQHIADGLIPRFLLIEYHGDRPNRNDYAFVPPNDTLVDRFASLAETSLRMMANNAFQDVQVDSQALHLLAQFDKRCDIHIRAVTDEATRQLWNRAHLKALRLAALLAAADRVHNPVVNVVEAQWAIDVVFKDIATLANRVEAGDIGEGASKQQVDMIRVINEYFDRPFKDVKQYGVLPGMHKVRVVPYVYIQRRVTNLSAFRKDRRGARMAIRETLQELIDSGILIEVSKQQALNDFKFQGKCYYVR